MLRAFRNDSDAILDGLKQLIGTKSPTKSFASPSPKKNKVKSKYKSLDRDTFVNFFLNLPNSKKYFKPDHLKDFGLEYLDEIDLE